MIVKINGQEISLVYYGTKAIGSIYYGTMKVYEGIRSCFGSGAWINAKPWLNTDGWKN